MSGHTKAPLSGKTVKVCFVEFEKLGITVSIPQYADAEAKANSRRMIACFEALEGLTTEQIEDGVFQKMRHDRDFLAAEVDALTKQRDELLYELKKIASVKPSLMHDENQQEVIVYSPYYNPFKIARDAIADKQEG